MSDKMRIHSWRYCCPDCGSVKTKRRYGGLSSIYDKPRIYCKNCARTIDTVYDKKKGIEVSI